MQGGAERGSVRREGGDGVGDVRPSSVTGGNAVGGGDGETARFRLGVRIGIAVFRQPRRHLRREDAGVVRASVDHALPGVGARAPGGCARRPFHIRGLRGGETVHVFGQSTRPCSAVIPNAVGGGSLRVATLALADELGGIPGDHPVVPGFLRVQVLRPGQPAAGAECVNILLAEDDATALELDALRRGARVGACSILSVDDTCRELLEDAGLDAPLAPIAEFVSESAARGRGFAGDFKREPWSSCTGDLGCTTLWRGTRRAVGDHETGRAGRRPRTRSCHLGRVGRYRR